MTKSQIAKSMHDMLSAYAVSIGEEPYKPYDEINEEYKKLLEGAVDLIEFDCCEPNSVTAKHIHNYWMNWAKVHKPDHTSIIPFEELSETEKIKDQLVINVIKGMLLFS